MKMQKTILRYAGGKSKAIKKITPFVTPYKEVVSPFLGGGSLEVHWASMGKKVYASDVFDILVNFWNILLSDSSGLADELSKIKPNEDEYRAIKEKLIQTPQVQKMLENWKTDFYQRDPVSIDNLTMAAYYYFNHNCSYGPGFLGWASKIYMKQDRWDRTIQKVRDFDCPNLFVTNESFETAIENNKGKFLYLDPPYYIKKDTDNKMLGGIYPMKNIPVHHSSFDHELLRDLLLNHDGDFVLSYNNCETIRDWYKDYEHFFPEWHYSMDIGEKRVGKNRKERVEEKDLKEADRLTMMIKELEKSPETNKTKIAELKTKRHEIMKKESHEILIVKRS
jgi:DNA adenine methylase